jgi:hypothetical protein
MNIICVGAVACSCCGFVMGFYSALSDCVIRHGLLFHLCCVSCVMVRMHALAQAGRKERTVRPELLPPACRRFCSGTFSRVIYDMLCANIRT